MADQEQKVICDQADKCFVTCQHNKPHDPIETMIGKFCNEFVDDCIYKSICKPVVE